MGAEEGRKTKRRKAIASDDVTSRVCGNGGEDRFPWEQEEGRASTGVKTAEVGFFWFA